MIDREQSRHAQALFEKFNQMYWGGRLPRYKVLVSTRYGGQGLCRRDVRRIYLTPGLNASLEKVLLHEMCHVAVNDNHGEKWLAEMLRLAELGAPTRGDWEIYQDPHRVYDGKGEILSQFEEAGQDDPAGLWSAVRQSIGYSYSMVDEHGKAKSKGTARFLRRARKHFYAGQRDRRELDQAQKQLRAQINPKTTNQETNNETDEKAGTRRNGGVA